MSSCWFCPDPAEYTVNLNIPACSFHIDLAKRHTRKEEIPMTQPNLEQTLAERGGRYGDFSDNARVSQTLQQVMELESGWKNLTAVQREALTVITQKIARILNGDPNYHDNWHDIGGYAKLAEDRCNLGSSLGKPLAKVPVGTAYSPNQNPRG